MKSKKNKIKSVIRTNIKFSKDFKNQLKKLAVDRESNIAEMVEEAVSSYYKIGSK